MKKFVIIFIVLLLQYSIVSSPVLADVDFCPGPGNNLIDNISPEVLVNLHHDAGSPNCWLTATFLLRTNDLSNPNLVEFFKAAAANKIYPIIRIGSENNGDNWPVISPSLAAGNATYLNQAISSANFPKIIYAELGNEINLNNEWGGRADPNSYAASLIAFADKASAFKVILPPLVLNNQASVGYDTFYQQLKTSLDDDWLETRISGYGLNLYGRDSGSIINDKNRAINALTQAGFKTDGKVFIITEIGLPGGIYSGDTGSQACNFYKSILADSAGYDFVAATIFSRDDQNRVHAFYYQQNNCAAAEYRLAIINLGGSASYGQSTGYPQAGQIVYPPLGSLEQCPQVPISNGTCSPTNQTGNLCNSECSPPVEIDQNLFLTNGSSCSNGNCHAQIKIQGNKIPVPGQIKELADYFERLAPYFLSKQQQDDLRCKFIKYVKDTPNSKHKDLTIDGKLVSGLPCDPQQPGWSKIPLFPNDDSLGKIEFVSPSLATIQPVNVAIPDIQRLNLTTKTLQNALIPAVPSQPKTYGQAIALNSAANSCQPTKTWDNLYGADYDRAVTCNFGANSPLAGVNNTTGCVLLPDGTLECQRNETSGSGFRRYSGTEATVQVRTVFPHLYEASEQSISFLQGFLQIFRPEKVDEYKKAYTPLPAAVDGVKYELTGSSGLAINDTGHKQTGWQLFFYDVGGIWNAKNFVLEMLKKP